MGRKGCEFSTISLYTESHRVYKSDSKSINQTSGKVPLNQTAVDVTLHVVHRLMNTENATVGHNLFCTIFGMYII